ncbi:MAG TPA: YciI family protein [Pyrinomonadaceae bacterium]|mgnify:CR=1 FL=1|nr:YciI family protein [Pyrinomonadaceae bacterium]
MKNARKIFLMFAMSALGALTAFAQVPDVPAKPQFDADLAKKLSADDYGMKTYVFCILKTGPKDAEIKDAKQRSEIFAGHMANMKRLGEAGKLALAGPFGKNDRAYRGIFIFNVATVEEAQKLVDTDPVISSGMMVAELTPWYGSAAVLLVNDNHKKVAKKDL